MRNARVTDSVCSFLAAMQLVVSAPVCATESSAAPCQPPTVQKILSNYPSSRYIPDPVAVTAGDPVAIPFPIASDPRHLWLGLRWSGPTGGVLLVVNCAGKPEASISLGAVQGIRLLPMPREISTYEVTYIAATGSGYSRSQVSIIRYRSGKIQLLWTHIMDEMYAGFADKNYEDRFTWMYSPNGKSIAVRGTREKGGAGAADHVITEPLAEVRYCWHAKSKRFLLCHDSNTRRQTRRDGDLSMP
jgi:hypothetical protein